MVNKKRVKKLRSSVCVIVNLNHDSWTVGEDRGTEKWAGMDSPTLIFVQDHFCKF